MSGNNTLWSFVKKYKWNSIFLKYAAMIFTFIVLPTTIIFKFLFMLIDLNFFIEFLSTLSFFLFS